MRLGSLLLILVGGLALILPTIGYDLKIVSPFGEYQNVAASTILATGIILRLLSFVKRGDALDQSNDPPSDGSND